MTHYINNIIKSASAHHDAAHDILTVWEQRLAKHNDTIDAKLKSDLAINFLKDLDKLDGEVLTKADIIMQIVEQLDTQNVEEFLKGAHFNIKDGGQLYNSLKEYGYERISSHHGNDKPSSDIGIKAGNTFAQLLVGVKSDGTSWFQIENSPMPNASEIVSDLGAFQDFIHHTVDTSMYIACKTLPFLTPVNIGQYGTSSHLDYNPIVLEKPIALGTPILEAYQNLVAHLEDSNQISQAFHGE